MSLLIVYEQAMVFWAMLPCCLYHASAILLPLLTCHWLIDLQVPCRPSITPPLNHLTAIGVRVQNAICRDVYQLLMDEQDEMQSH